MKLSAKTDYGVRALVDLATRTEDAPSQAKQIARRQRIPYRFLEQVLSSLRKAGLVESTRGAQGGYVLSRQASEIRISDVLEAVEGGPQGKNGGNVESPFSEPDVPDDLLSPIWKEAQSALSSVLERFTIQDLCNRKKEREEARVMMFHI